MSEAGFEGNEELEKLAGKKTTTFKHVNVIYKHVVCSKE